MWSNQEYNLSSSGRDFQREHGLASSLQPNLTQQPDSNLALSMTPWTEFDSSASFDPILNHHGQSASAFSPLNQLDQPASAYVTPPRVSTWSTNMPTDTSANRDLVYALDLPDHSGQVSLIPANFNMQSCSLVNGIAGLSPSPIYLSDQPPQISDTRFHGSSAYPNMGTDPAMDGGTGPLLGPIHSSGQPLLIPSHVTQSSSLNPSLPFFSTTPDDIAQSHQLPSAQSFLTTKNGYSRSPQPPNDLSQGNGVPQPFSQAPTTPEDNKDNFEDLLHNPYIKWIVQDLMRNPSLNSLDAIIFFREIGPWVPNPRWMDRARFMMQVLETSVGQPYSIEDLERVHQLSFYVRGLHVCITYVFDRQPNLVKAPQFRFIWETAASLATLKFDTDLNRPPNLTSQINSSQRPLSSFNSQLPPYTQTNLNPQLHSSFSIFTEPFSASDSNHPYEGQDISSLTEDADAGTRENGNNDDSGEIPSLSALFTSMLNYMVVRHNLTSERDCQLLESAIPWNPTPDWIAPAMQAMELHYVSKGYPYDPENLKMLHSMSRTYVNLRKCLELAISRHGSIMFTPSFAILLKLAGEVLANGQDG
ncbi:hypothetical protein K470DRAFT_266204 [Piedraia hortae CBS 480.64]|uniref:Uncharacterized protein n=1 Tax=Piedraia hortae CBS 480.64 TaxID=1314780 RepID=A0A6A7BU71_9PEZI|nr:hypothetical protein K470DRAFT_266204 [Piedraia hortae CBS 480.64]